MAVHTPDKQLPQFNPGTGVPTPAYDPYQQYLLPHELLNALIERGIFDINGRLVDSALPTNINVGATAQVNEPETITGLWNFTTPPTVNGAQISPGQATTTLPGTVELATALETTTGTDGVRAVTPLGLASALAGKANTVHTHTSTQMTDFTEAVQDVVGAMLISGGNITLAYDDNTGQVTMTATGGGGTDAEVVRDTIGAAIIGLNGLGVAINDAADTITLSIGTHAHSAADITSGTMSVEQLPAGSTLTVAKSGGTWPARPTARGDVVVIWKGADPSPAVVSSGTGGMRDNVDMRMVTP